MKYILLFLFCLPFAVLFSQSSEQYVIVPQGGYASGTSISMSWTIGDFVTQTSSFRDGYATQGFQQPGITIKKLDTPASDPKNLSFGSNQNLSSHASTELNAEVYPNPVNTDVTVNITNGNKEYYVDILDPAGNLLSRNKSRNAQEVIHMAQLPAAQYILRISLPDAQQAKVFQIIKTN